MKINEFWDLTPEEIEKSFKGFAAAEQFQEKMRVSNNYMLASMIANFTGAVLNGKEIPDLLKLYPELKDDLQARLDDEETERIHNSVIAEQFKAFARAHNEQRRKG